MDTMMQIADSINEKIRSLFDLEQYPGKKMFPLIKRIVDHELTADYEKQRDVCSHCLQTVVLHNYYESSGNEDDRYKKPCNGCSNRYCDSEDHPCRWCTERND